MIKKLILLLFLMPVISMAGDSYDSTTGIVTMPNVSVGAKTYNVKMEHQGNSVFKVTSANPISSSTIPSTSIPDTFDSETGILHMLNVVVGVDNFEVSMIHKGDLVFEVTYVTHRHDISIRDSGKKLKIDFFKNK